jgi:hypothetical protein
MMRTASLANRRSVCSATILVGTPSQVWALVVFTMSICVMHLTWLWWPLLGGMGEHTLRPLPEHAQRVLWNWLGPMCTVAPGRNPKYVSNPRAVGSPSSV